MRVRFILGRAGTGKSELCFREIGEKTAQDPLGPPLLLLVPEQSTFQSEMTLALKEGRGLGRAQVISFQRLGWMVLQEAGGSTRPFLGETGRHMVLEHILARREKELKVFKGYLRRPDLAQALGRTIRQMKQAGMNSELLARQASKWEEKRSLFAAKARDLSIIMRELAEEIKSHSSDPDDYLELVASRIPQCPSLKKAEVWVDGFSGFTSQELKVLSSLITSTYQVNITLCLAPEYWEKEAEEGDLFYRTYRTFTQLKKLVEKCGATLLSPSILTEPHRFSSAPELVHLEKCWEVWPRWPYEEKTDKIEILAAANRELEVETVAESILRLIKQEGLQFRDILVMTRDLSSYAPLVRRVFSSLDIPCFIDHKPPIDSHPLAVLTIAALEIAALNWPNSAVFRYLKTGLTGVEPKDVDLVENYVLASGINGSTWKNIWQYRPRSLFGDKNEDAVQNELDLLNAIRVRIVEPLSQLEERLKKTDNAGEMSSAVLELLQQLKVEDIMQKLIEEAQREGRQKEVQEHIGVYQAIVGLLHEMALAFGDHPLSVKEYLNSFQAGVKATTLGLIPPGLDQVMVGNMDRSRYSEAKVVFILGANEGLLPAVPANDGVLSEQDLEYLRLEGMDLPVARLKAFEEPFLIYTALTRSRHYLKVSYALADLDGTPLAPSSVIKDLKALFPNLKEIFRSPENLIPAEDPEELLHPHQAFNLLAGQYRTAKKELPLFWQEVRDFLWLKDNYRYRLLVLENGRAHLGRKEELSSAVAEQLFPSAFSVTDLEKYAACPYAFFVERGLKARERALAELRATDVGQFFHAMAKEFLGRLQKAAQDDWNSLSDDVIEKVLEQAIADVEQELEQEIKLASPRGQYLKERLKDVAKEAARICLEQVKAGSFVPHWLEMPFTIKMEELEESEQNMPSGVYSLRGRIDRVDVCEDNEKVWLRIVDYKSRALGIDLSKLYHGLSLQLFLYMKAALNKAQAEKKGEPEVAGIFLFPIERPLVDKQKMEGRDLKKEIKKRLRLRGFLLKDLKVASLMDKELTSGSSWVIPVQLTRDGNFYGNSTGVLESEKIELLKDYAFKKARSLMADIRQGKIGITPYRMAKNKACDYCSFRPVCQFDEVTGHSYRWLKKLSRDEVWNLLGGERRGESSEGKMD